MKTLFFILSFSFSILGFGQRLSCQEAYEIVLKNGTNKRTIKIINSSMLNKVEKYEVDGSLYVIGWIKSNDYDYKGKPYLFCGVSRWDWNMFATEYISSAGEAFHKYIFPYKCNCY